MKIAILLFGASGFIGKNISSFFSKQNIPFYPLTRKECDIRDYKKTEAIFGKFENENIHVINVAAVDKYNNNTYDSFIENVNIAHSFYNATKNAKILSFIHISSFDVYGKMPQLPITEESKINPDTWYALSKIVVEQIFTISPIIHNVLTILRIPGVYALNNTDTKSVIAKFIRIIQERKSIIIENEGNTLRDYVHVDDIVQIVKNIIFSKKHYGIINVATGESTSIYNIIGILSKHIGIDTILENTASSDRSFDIVTDIKKLKTFFPDYSPQTLTEVLQKFYPVESNPVPFCQ